MADAVPVYQRDPLYSRMRHLQLRKRKLATPLHVSFSYPHTDDEGADRPLGLAHPNTGTGSDTDTPGTLGAESRVSSVLHDDALDV
jgi:hypothetical protein